MYTYIHSYHLTHIPQMKDIANLVRTKYPNVIMVMDEVYEKLVYDGKRHEHMASIAWDQTITVSSAGIS